VDVGTTGVDRRRDDEVHRPRRRPPV